MPTTVTISVPEELKAFIDERTKSGKFNSPGEFIQQLIREDKERAEKERLEEMLLHGLDGGESIRATDAYWDDLQRRVEQRAAGQKASAETRE